MHTKKKLERTRGAALKRDTYSWLALEGIVIVVSILLAFGIDAAWDARNETHQERAALRALIRSAELSSEWVAMAQAQIETDQAMVLSLYATPDGGPRTIPRDSVNALMFALIRPGTAGFGEGPLSGIARSERGAELRDPRVRDALDSWLFRVAELEERQAILSQLEAKALVELGRFQLVQLGASSATVLPDIPILLEDEAVRAHIRAISLTRALYANHLTGLEEELAAVRAAASAALEGNQ